MVMFPNVYLVYSLVLQATFRDFVSFLSILFHVFYISEYIKIIIPVKIQGFYFLQIKRRTINIFTCEMSKNTLSLVISRRSCRIKPILTWVFCLRYIPIVSHISLYKCNTTAFPLALSSWLKAFLTWISMSSLKGRRVQFSFERSVCNRCSFTNSSPL